MSVNAWTVLIAASLLLLAWDEHGSPLTPWPSRWVYGFWLGAVVARVVQWLAR